MRTLTGSLVAVLLALVAAPAALAAEECLNETYRPQYHFSPRKHWINDPNGLIYHDETWHMFYQYDPTASIPSGHVSWGHAVSSDLIHWEEQDVAIAATSDIEIFSGSAVIDTNNTAGFGAGAMVAIYTCYNLTSTIQTQCIAYSLNNGTNFTKYEGNPVIDLNMTEFRDPSVQWYSAGGHWLMAVSLASERKIRFYKSENLKSWTKLSDFGPAGWYNVSGLQYECPDLFKMTVENDTADTTKWILIVNINPGAPYGGSAAQYFIGTFNGTDFTADDDEVRWLDHGMDNYAAITWKGAPDGEVYLIGWMSNWKYSEVTPTTVWRNAMTLPRKLTLTLIDDEVVLRQMPVEAVYALKSSSSYAKRAPRKGASFTLVNESVDLTPLLTQQGAGRARRGTRVKNFSGKAFYLSVTLSSPTTATQQGVKVREGTGQYTKIQYNAANGTVSINRTLSGNVSFDTTYFPGTHGGAVTLRDGAVRLDVFVDWSSVEVFANSGELAITDTIFPNASSKYVELFVENGRAEFDDLTLYTLDSYRDCD